MKRTFPTVSLAMFFAVASGMSSSVNGLRAGEPLPGSIFVSDSTDDRIVRLQDLDRSGEIEAEVPGEITVFFDAAGGFELSVPSHLTVDGEGNLYVLDGGTLDSILVLRDENENGHANDEGEMRVYYDNSAASGLALFTPNSMVFLADGSLLVADDGSAAKRLLRLVDLNGDGDALDEGEGMVAYDGTSAAPVTLEDPESLSQEVDGSIFVGDSTLEAVFRFRDLDDNGDFLGPDEVNLFFQGSERFPLTDIDALSQLEDGRLFAANEDTGLVVLLRDLDGDGDANGEGESRVFVDSPSITDLNDMQLVRLAGKFALMLVDGRTDLLYLACDLNDDGDAIDDGEVRPLNRDETTFATPSAAVHQGSSPLPSDGLFVRGDANQDGMIDLTDAVNILGFLFRGVGGPGCQDAKDVDDDGEINIADAISLLNFLFSGGTEPSPPYPQIGSDPTEDDLSCPSSAA